MNRREKELEPAHIPNVKDIKGRRVGLFLAPNMMKVDSSYLLAAKEYAEKEGFDIVHTFKDIEGHQYTYTSANGKTSISVHQSDAKNIIPALKTIGKLDSEDLLLIYTAGHGTQEMGTHLPRLEFEDGHVSAIGTVQAIDHYLGDSYRIGVGTTCYGFDFINQLVTNEKHIGVSAAGEGKKAYEGNFPKLFFGFLENTGDAEEAFGLAMACDEHAIAGRTKPSLVKIVEGERIILPSYEANKKNLVYTPPEQYY